MQYNKNNPRKPSLTGLIVSGFFIVIIFLSLLFALGFSSIYKYNNTLRDNTYARGFKIAIVSDMVSTTYQRAESTLLLYTSSQEEASLHEENYQTGKEDFAIAIQGLSGVDQSAEQQKIIENILLLSSDVDTTHQQILEHFLYHSGEEPPVTVNEIRQLYETLDNAIKNLLEFEQIGWFREVSNSIDRNETQYTTGLVLFIAVLLVSIFVAWRVLRSALNTESLLHKEKEYAEATLFSIAEGVITVDSVGMVTQINKTAEKLTGWSEEEAKERPLSDVYKAKTLVSNLALEHPANDISAGYDSNFDRTHNLFSRDGKNKYHVESGYSIVMDGSEAAGAVLIIRDITESQKMSEQLQWQASHDSLTGLINRNSFEKQIELSINEVSEAGTEFALLYIDLDQFKIVNDTCGHTAGDQLLSQIGIIFQQHIRKTDILARLGGDEFGMLLYGCNEKRAFEISEKILDSISEFRFTWEDKVFSIGASIGFVMIEDGSATLAELLSAADIACYAAKDSGRGCVKKYDAEISVSASEMTMSGKINEAIDKDQLRLYFQTIAPINAGDEAVCEILLRMEYEGELVYPNQFLPAAERFNLMRNIDRWVITNTFKHIDAENKNVPGGKNNCRYCINLSGASINDTALFDFIHEKIKQYNIPTDCLCFEITETVAITNLNNAATLINKIRDLGCALALDDFGTGASSFAYLKYLPVDYIKIDGTFIKDILTDDIDLEIVSAIINIARVLDIKTVAEFVETEEILAKVKSLGINYAQGYAISYPQELEKTPPLYQPRSSAN